MGIAAAKKYIRELHKKQENPYLWPDFLTGLPDKTAIIKKLDSIYPLLGKYAIAYIRIANIHPYLIKYGPDKHADIIQWAAAVLQTSSNKCRHCFVGTLNTHDFIVISESTHIMRHIRSASKIFQKRISVYYTHEDLKTETTLSFSRAGEQVRIGLMRFAVVVLNNKTRIERGRLIPDMGRICDSIEASQKELVFIAE